MTRRMMLAAGAAFAVPAFGMPPVVSEVAPGIFVRRGADAEATIANADGIANSGFVIGRESVCVTDPGGSFADGAWLRRAIRARTDRPIRHVILNHDHPDHIFGASAFGDDQPAFIGHHALAASLAARGDYYRDRLAAVLGAAAAGRWVAPTIAVRDTLAIDLGDRILHITAQPPAHTRCDLSMIDSRSGVLFAGDLLFVDRIPSLDGSLPGWLRALDAIEAMGARRAVPGHGPVVVDLHAACAPLRRYLTIVRDETRQAIAHGVPIDVAARTVGRSERDHWRLFDAYHARNIVEAYKELEWE